jgi:hypothetical protein
MHVCSMEAITLNHPSLFPLRPRITLGRVVATPGALASLRHNGVVPMALLLRHICGDWGDICSEDWQQNELAVASGLRVLSVYTMPDHTKIWVITEWDRSVTTVLSPDDY